MVTWGVDSPQVENCALGHRCPMGCYICLCFKTTGQCWNGLLYFKEIKRKNNFIFLTISSALHSFLKNWISLWYYFLSARRTCVAFPVMQVQQQLVFFYLKRSLFSFHFESTATPELCCQLHYMFKKCSWPCGRNLLSSCISSAWLDAILPLLNNGHS